MVRVLALLTLLQPTLLRSRRPCPEDVMSPTDLSLLEEKETAKIGLKTVQKKHWQKALAHAKYLESINFDKPPAPLHLWLER